MKNRIDTIGITILGIITGIGVAIAVSLNPVLYIEGTSERASAAKHETTGAMFGWDDPTAFNPNLVIKERKKVIRRIKVLATGTLDGTPGNYNVSITAYGKFDGGSFSYPDTQPGCYH